MLMDILKDPLLCLAHIYTFKSLALVSIQRHKLLFISVHRRKDVKPMLEHKHHIILFATDSKIFQPKL